MKVKSTELRTFVDNKVYAMINGKMQECKLKRTNFFAAEEGWYTVTHVVELPGGVIDSEHVNFDTAYRTPADYQNKRFADTRSEDINTLYCFMLMEASGKNRWKAANLSFYTFEYGKVVKHTPEMQDISYDYEKKQWSTSDIPSNKQIYSTHALACSYNTIQVLNEDGTESELIGANKLLMLDQDQQELIGRLEEIVRELKEHDVRLIADTSDCYYAYNARHVDDFRLSFDDLPDDVPAEVAVDYEDVDRFGAPFRVDMDYVQYSEDNNLFVLRKK